MGRTRVSGTSRADFKDPIAISRRTVGSGKNADACFHFHGLLDGLDIIKGHDDADRNLMFFLNNARYAFVLLIRDRKQ